MRFALQQEWLGDTSLNEAEWVHAERLAELLLEQLEYLQLSEHAEASILTAVARRLVRRSVELGEVIESEARDLNDLSALQMATALQALGPSIDRTLEIVAEHGRFGLMPGREPVRLPSPPPPPPHEATGTDDPPPPPRPLWPRRRRARYP
ncbi:MAG: hypothetical protein U0893_27735 [Chloroflexota bacterium]